mgnify:CR=1 FL=1
MDQALEDEPEDAAGGRPEGHAQADLPDPPADHVGQDHSTTELLSMTSGVFVSGHCHPTSERRASPGFLGCPLLRALAREFFRWHEHCSARVGDRPRKAV